MSAAANNATQTRPRVYVIGTGGTISCVGDTQMDLMNYNHADKHFTIAEMLARVPAIAQCAEIRAEQFMNVYGGGVSPAKWLDLARRINQIFRDDPVAAGVVVTHGTSTLEETAYFLNLTVKTSKAVVVGGAMRPPTALSTDADINLFDAVRVAAHPDSVGKGVLVVLNNRIMAARDAVKTNTSRIDTFTSNELGFLGYADSDGSVVYYRAPVRAHTIATEFDVEKLQALPRVDIATAYSGADGIAVDAFVRAGCAGLIGAGSGSGSSPLAFLDALEAARKRGVAVVLASQSFNGRVMARRTFTERGLVVADNLPPKKARILLMLALGVSREPADIQRMVLKYEGPRYLREPENAQWVDMLLHAALVVACTGIACAACAQAPVPDAKSAYPARVTRIILPFAEGGTGFVGRWMALKLTDALGISVVVDPRTGAGGSIGFEST